MNESIKQFSRKVVADAIATVIRGDAHDARLVFRVNGSTLPLCLTIEICPPRHGCGWEQDSYWAHTNENDRFGAAHGLSLSVAKNDSNELVDAVCEFLERSFIRASRVEATLVYMPHQGQSYLPVLEGDSDSGTLRDIPEFNGC